MMTLPTSATMLSTKPLSCSTSALIALTSWDACIGSPALHPTAQGGPEFPTLSALFDRGVGQPELPLVDLGRAVDPVVLQLLQPVGEPAGRAGDREDRREQVARD